MPPRAIKIDDFLSEITDAHPGIREIWLFGSRAKGDERPGSDWNLLAFADEDTFKQLCRNLQFRRADTELLVVLDGDEFREPWGERPKSGYLSEWEWVKSSDREAQYHGTKWVQDEKGGRTEIQLCKAIRLWPVDKR